MAKSLIKYLNPAVVSKVGQFVLNPKGLVEGMRAGAHKSPFHGFSVEFAGHREYMPGDDPKHIDWNVYYKRDRYYIKQYEAETNLTCSVLMDTSASMRYTSHDVSKFDYASYLATGLSWMVTGAADSFGFTLFDEKITTHLTPSNSLGAVYTINRVLEECEPVKQTQVAKTLIDFASRLGRRQIVVLISDFLNDPKDLSKGLARLKYDQHEVVLVQVLDPRELDFEFEGRVKFMGLECGDAITLQPKQVRKAYKEKIDAHIHEIRVICEKNGVEYQLANTEHSVEEFFFSYMTSRLTHISR